jgi:pimeloyl-ACP methyl ester carboxylesterase
MLLRRNVNRALATIRIVLVLLLAAAGVSGCATRKVGSVGSERSPQSRNELYPLFDDAFPDLALEITRRELVEGVLGERLLRIGFSFVSYRGYIAPEEVRRSTGTLLLPIDSSGRARAQFGEVLVAEFPPGSSASGFPFHVEYGERPAIELGAPAAIVDLRGPIAKDLRNFRNPDDPAGSTFVNEEQFGYAMLRSFQETGDLRLLYEVRVAEAWLRALSSLERILARELSRTLNRFLLAGESYGALGAAQAAAVHPEVSGLVLCGWPLDWVDLHYTRWRRWERQAYYRPLEPLQPMPYKDSQEVLSFLFSSYSKPDPGCPSCIGAGEVWRKQLNYLDLRKSGSLHGVRTLVLVGDSDPQFPIDLEIRASVPGEAIEASPGLSNGTIWVRGAIARAAYTGPFSTATRLPFEDLLYLREAPSKLANREAAAAVLAWVQHLAGFRDTPQLTIREWTQDGDLVVEVQVGEGNASVSSVELYLTEIDDRQSSDFKFRTHQDEPEPVAWRRFDAIYSGHEAAFLGKWRAYLPSDRSRNRAYYVIVRDRVGTLESAHSLPVRPFWYLGDPAVGPVRF